MTKLSEDYKVNSDIYMSNVDDLTLSKILIARDLFCHPTHKGYLGETCQTLIFHGQGTHLQRHSTPASVI